MPYSNFSFYLLNYILEGLHKFYATPLSSFFTI